MTVPPSPDLAALPPRKAGRTLSTARSLGGWDDIARLGSTETPEGYGPAVGPVASGFGLNEMETPAPCARVIKVPMTSDSGFKWAAVVADLIGAGVIVKPWREAGHDRLIAALGPVGA